MSMNAAVAHSREHLRQVQWLTAVVQDIQRAGVSPRARIQEEAWHKRLLIEQQWEDALGASSDTIFALVDLDGAIAYAQSSWTKKRRWSWIRRDGETPIDEVVGGQPAAYLSPNQQELEQRLAATVNAAMWAQGAVQVYLGMAIQTSNDAGTFALKHMGMDQTWAWAHPRSMAQDLFGVRGSKVIQGMYGEHIASLSRIIASATDPRHPLTIQQVKARIAEQWPGLKKYQVARIARTETAAVWTATSANAYIANGVEKFQSSIAHGPTIGVSSSDPCEVCVEASVETHFLGDDLPPWHPNCRCEIYPLLEGEEGGVWLPPDEPFTGGAAGAKLPVCGSKLAAREDERRVRLVGMGARIKKKAAGPGCIVPAPAPGEAFGGSKYENIEVTTDKLAAKALLDQIESKWVYDAPKAAARKLIEDMQIKSEEEDALIRLLVARDASGSPTALAGMIQYESVETTHVLGLVSQQGGARRLVTEIARDAHEKGWAMTVGTQNISPQMAKILEGLGFKGGTEGKVYYLSSSEIPKAFKFDVVPPALAPATSPVPTVVPTGITPSVVDIPDLKAQLYSANNRISGLKTRAKKLAAKKDAGIATGADLQKLEEVQNKLIQEFKNRNVLKDKIAGIDPAAGEYKVPPHPEPPAKPATEMTVAEVPAPPTEIPYSSDLESLTKDHRSTVPGGTIKEKGTSALLKPMTEANGMPSKAKMDVQTKILRRLDKDERWTRYSQDAINDAFRYTPLADRIQGQEKVVRDLIHNWAVTSSDADARGVAIQIAAAEELGLDVKVFAASHWNDSAKSDVIVQQAYDLLNKTGVRDSLRAFVRAQYEETQATLKALGVDEITVYRGMRIKGESPYPVGVSVIDVKDNPLASWSIRHNVSRRSHFYGGTMLRASVPREMVFSTPLTGFGCANEYEVLIMNNGVNRAWVAQSGQARIEGERLSEMTAKHEELQAKITELNAQSMKRWGVDTSHGTPPGVSYSSPEWYEYNGLSHQASVLRSESRDLATKISDGSERWSYKTETELKKEIQKQLDENAALAGKPVSAPKKPPAEGGSTLTPEKQARNRVTSARHRLKTAQEELDQWNKDWPSGGTVSQEIQAGEKLRAKVSDAQVKLDQVTSDLEKLLAEGATPAEAEVEAIVAKPVIGLKGAKAEESLIGYSSKWNQTLVPAERNALNQYTMTSGEVNGYLRTGLNTAGNKLSSIYEAELKKDIARMDSALAKASLPDAVTVLRGIRDPEAVFGVTDFKSLLGTEYKDAGFTSSTTDKKIAEWFGGFENLAGSGNGAMLEITVPKGAHAGWLDVSGITDQGERELLIARNSRFRVTGVTEGPKGVTIKVEMLK